MHKHFNFENKRVKRVRYKKKYGQFFSKNQTFKTLLQENWKKIGKIENCIQKRHLAIFTNIFSLRLLG